MGGRKVKIDLNTVCSSERQAGNQTFNNFFSSQADMLSSRADILNAKDRALMKMYHLNGLTFRQIAQVAGTNETTIARRIHKLSAKLIDGEYLTCVRNRDKFNRIEMAVARGHYLEGISQKQIAKNLGMTVYSTRKTLLKIQRILELCGRQRIASNGQKANIQYPSEH